MEAIILAGGFGSRLKSVVSEVPKPMAPISGRPFLEILLTSLSLKGLKRAVLSVGYKGDLISDHFGNFYNGIEIVYAREDSPLGTGGALREAMQLCMADHVYVFNGDTYTDVEITRLEKQWQQNKNPIIVGREVNDVARFGALEIDGNQLRKFAEKSSGGRGIINAGCYVFPSSLFEDFGLEKFSLEADFLINQIKKQRFEVFITKGMFIDIGIPEDYERAQAELCKLA